MEQNQSPKKPMSPGLVAVCVVCGCIMFLGFWFILFGQFFGNLFGSLANVSDSTYMDTAIYGDTLDVITVEGTIGSGEVSYQHEWTLNQIDELTYNDNNKGILLYVNSPGGAIYAADELYLKLKQYKEITGRPVYAYMAEEAASAGVYICMPADKIFASRMTLTGSIGVYMGITDTSGFQELIGIKDEYITSGKNKVMDSPISAEQRQIIQDMVDEYYDIFIDVIVTERNLDKELVLEKADGRIYTASQAKEWGLIDEIATYEETLAYILSTEGFEDCMVNVQTPPVSTLERILYGMKNELSTVQGDNLDKALEYIEESKSPKMMYYRQQ